MKIMASLTITSSYVQPPPAVMGSMGPSRWSLSGRRVVVTGSTKGIGFAVADEVLQLGGMVLIVSRTESDVVATVKAMKKKYGSGRCAGVVADVASDEAHCGR